MRDNDGERMTEERAPVTQLTTKFTRAVDYARVLHASDVRKRTTIPYLAHLLAVASIVLEYGGTEDQAIAGLLHDAGEDHGGKIRIDNIEAEFGETVARIVEACSDDLPAPGKPKRPWFDRKTAYIERLPTEPVDVVLVSAADKLHNARAILTDYRHLHEDLWAKFNTGRDGTLWYYRGLCDVIDVKLASSAPQLARELRATLDALTAEIAACSTASDVR